MDTKLIVRLVILLFFASPLYVKAKITLNPLFSDGMVLQQKTKDKIWGNSDKLDHKVTVKTSWDNKEFFTKTDKEGKWNIIIETPGYGGPYSIEISDGEKINIHNVMIGEVWLCSGQSNMNMNFNGNYNEPVLGSLDDLFSSENSQIRMFTVDKKMHSEPLTNCGGSWKESSPKNILEFSAVGYFFAKKIHEVLKIPIGIIHTSYGGSRVEAWMSKESLVTYKGMDDIHNGSILYNGMLSPIVGFGIRGCLWYQGEANVDAPDLYTKLFPDLVADWRNKWGIGYFPFYYAQIAPFNYNHGQGKGKDSSYLREAQMKCLDLIPSSGMVTLTDLGSPNTIHPIEKKMVGNRFAYMALVRTYGMEGLSSSGPIYKSMNIKENKIIISFDGLTRGLTSYHLPLTDFEIAGSDKVFYPAKAIISNDKKSVAVYSDKVNKPVSVRYAFKDYVKGSLFNMDGLPASSFRTDSW